MKHAFPNSGWTLELVKSPNPSHITINLYWGSKTIPTHQLSILKEEIVKLFEEERSTELWRPMRNEDGY